MPITACEAIRDLRALHIELKGKQTAIEWSGIAADLADAQEQVKRMHADIREFLAAVETVFTEVDASLPMAFRR